MSESAAPNVRHRSRRMLGRDPHESNRVSSPLELLFDLTFAVAFGAAASELAHALAHGHVGAGVVAFCFATFAISWAWINFTWFASAYDTDDWLYRLTTMLQMVGVLVLALGLKPMFASVTEHHDTLDLDVMVAGYVVMRIAMVLQWWRAGSHDRGRRDVVGTYLLSILAAQVLWVVLALVDVPVAATFVLLGVPFLIELCGPVYAETRLAGTPWHPHHIAERYGLMVIIALGEGLIGTMASINVLAEDALSWEVGLLALAGTALTFGIWWSYFAAPAGAILHAHRERSFGFGYGHLAVFGSIVAVGAGLHGGATYLDHATHLGLVGTVLAVAIPVSLYTLLLHAGYSSLTRTFDRLHVVLLLLTAVVIGIALVMAAADVELVWCLLVLSLAPWVSVVGYETTGFRRDAAVVEEAGA
ncbi:low temperature requirement protein A [Nocardioides kongjuensis]|uniref:Low temperature requirement protein LtrA n=1 Tax=Nocardioides kongjuensis TaxID=349522 RepID=A0A852RF03_9ACTN|nr:low temperature requirement protein A [Nocardioides kongjuensis]NYD31867.1 low temperature requirement protein LtrA [Nocardioides kongjuensis]